MNKGEEAKGTQEMLQAYKNAINAVECYGPTQLAPLFEQIRHYCMQPFSQRSQYYVILVVITSGQVSDLADTVAQMVDLADRPLSVIIMGVGDRDFTAMKMLDANINVLESNGKRAQRDIVQFVPFSKYKDYPALLAQDTLAALTHQVLSFTAMHQIVPEPPAPQQPLNAQYLELDIAIHDVRKQAELLANKRVQKLQSELEELKKALDQSGEYYNTNDQNLLQIAQQTWEKQKREQSDELIRALQALRLKKENRIRQIYEEYTNALERLQVQVWKDQWIMSEQTQWQQAMEAAEKFPPRQDLLQLRRLMIEQRQENRIKLVDVYQRQLSTLQQLYARQMADIHKDEYEQLKRQYENGLITMKRNIKDEIVKGRSPLFQHSQDTRKKYSEQESKLYEEHTEYINSLRQAARRKAGFLKRLQQVLTFGNLSAFSSKLSSSSAASSSSSSFPSSSSATASSFAPVSTSSTIASSQPPSSLASSSAPSLLSSVPSALLLSSTQSDMLVSSANQNQPVPLLVPPVTTQVDQMITTIEDKEREPRREMMAAVGVSYDEHDGTDRSYPVESVDVSRSMNDDPRPRERVVQDSERDVREDVGRDRIDRDALSRGVDNQYSGDDASVSSTSFYPPTSSSTEEKKVQEVKQPFEDVEEGAKRRRSSLDRFNQNPDMKKMNDDFNQDDIVRFLRSYIHKPLIEVMNEIKGNHDQDPIIPVPLNERELPLSLDDNLRVVFGNIRPTLWQQFTTHTKLLKSVDDWRPADEPSAKLFQQVPIRMQPDQFSAELPFRPLPFLSMSFIDASNKSNDASSASSGNSSIFLPSSSGPSNLSSALSSSSSSSSSSEMDSHAQIVITHFLLLDTMMDKLMDEVGTVTNLRHISYQTQRKKTLEQLTGDQFIIKQMIDQSCEDMKNQHRLHLLSLQQQLDKGLAALNVEKKTKVDKVTADYRQHMQPIIDQQMTDVDVIRDRLLRDTSAFITKQPPASMMEVEEFRQRLSREQHAAARHVASSLHATTLPLQRKYATILAGINHDDYRRLIDNYRSHVVALEDLSRQRLDESAIRLRDHTSSMIATRDKQLTQLSKHRELEQAFITFLAYKKAKAIRDRERMLLEEHRRNWNLFSERLEHVNDVTTMMQLSSEKESELILSRLNEARTRYTGDKDEEINLQQQLTEFIETSDKEDYISQAPYWQQELASLNVRVPFKPVDEVQELEERSAGFSQLQRQVDTELSADKIRQFDFLPGKAEAVFGRSATSTSASGGVGGISAGQSAVPNSTATTTMGGTSSLDMNINSADNMNKFAGGENNSVPIHYLSQWPEANAEVIAGKYDYLVFDDHFWMRFLPSPQLDPVRLNEAFAQCNQMIDDYTKAVIKTITKLSQQTGGNEGGLAMRPSVD